MAKVLVVDDDADVLDILCTSLAVAHSVERASSGLAALEILEKGAPIDLLLTDIIMPGSLHGFGLARMARLRRPDLRVLYFSGHLAEAMADYGAKFGPILQKPLRPDALLRAIDEVLKAPPAQPQH